MSMPISIDIITASVIMVAIRHYDYHYDIEFDYDKDVFSWLVIFILISDYHYDSGLMIFILVIDYRDCLINIYN